jgi:hypothetical protein
MHSNRIVLAAALAAVSSALPLQYWAPYGNPSFSPDYSMLQRYPSFGFDEPAAAPSSDLLPQFKVMEDDLAKLTAKEHAFDGKPDDALAIVPLSEALVKDMKKLTNSIKSGPQLSLLESANVGTEMLDFLPKAQEALTNIYSKKNFFDKLNTSNVVIQQLTKERKAGQALADSLLAKVPEIAKDQVTDMWTPVKATFDDVISKYQASEDAADA